MKCLEFAFEQGFDTSVSCEPLLDGNATELVEAVLPFVTDTIWLGKPNNLVGAVSTNTGKDEDLKQRARELNAIMTLEYFQELFRVFGSNPTIRWKDSVKDMLGLERPDMRGQDV
jgi:hypothetical protein